MPSEVHRLHPLSLLFRLGGSVRSLFVPLVLLVFFSSGGDEFQWLFWAVGVSAIVAVFQYVTHRYRFTGDELVVTGGLLFRFERHIPYERIQNIDLTQNVFHRLFRVADVKIETASGSEAEAHLQVLSLDAVETMRERVTAGRGRAGRVAPERAVSERTAAGDAAPGDPAAPDAARHAPPPRTLLRLRPRDLLLFGLISNRGMAVVLAASGLLWELDLVDEERLESVDELPFTDVDPEQLPWAVLVVGGVLTLVLLLRVLSVTWAFWTLHGFTLERRGDDLRTSCGLFTRLTATIPRARIQAVTVTETLLHRVAGVVAVKVDTAGGSLLEEKAATRSWAAPIVARDRLDALLGELCEGLRLDDVAWQPVHPCARRRISRRRAVVVTALAAVAAWWWSPWVLVGLPVAVLAALWDARRRVALMGYAVGDVAFVARRGLWRRTIRLVRRAKIQVVSRRESPFDRRWGTVAMRVDIAGTHDASAVPYLDAGVAASLVERLAEGAPVWRDAAAGPPGRDADAAWGGAEAEPGVDAVEPAVS